MLRAIVLVMATAAFGCGLSLDLDPTPPAFDAGETPPDGGAGCARDTHWPSDGTCGYVLFADAFEAPTIRSDWVLLRTEFAIQSGHLAMLPQPRALPGGMTFDYGHSANGRGGIAVLNVDGHLGRWTNYRVDWTESMRSTDEAFGPTGPLPPGFSTSGCDASVAFYFRAQAVTESWNSPPGATFYSVGARSGAAPSCDPFRGDWSIGASNGDWIPGLGFSDAYEGFTTALLSSSRDPGSPNPPYAGFPVTGDVPHDYAVEVRGATMDFWIDGTDVAQVTDMPMTMTGFDGTLRTHDVLTYGGVAFTGAFDELYWIDDVVVTALP